MQKYLFAFINKLKLRWKMVVLVLPLAIIPIFLVGGVIGYISTKQAYLGITQTSKDDLQHMAGFTVDLLNSHYQQFQVYKQDKEKTFHEELRTVSELAFNVVKSQQSLQQKGRMDMAAAQREARNALAKVNVGKTGYIYAMNSRGELKVHVAQEGVNVFDSRDETGRYFIREMIEKARRSKPGEVLYIVYPWRNAALGDKSLRKKVVAYRYFKEWDWIIAAGGYLEETYEDVAFERRSFQELKEKIKGKKVGKTGYIFAMDTSGNFMIHPTGEGKNFLNAVDFSGQHFIKEMCERKTGWIRYPWKNKGDSGPRMKIVRYEYFQPWNWIVAVGSYEEEFYQEANVIKGRIMESMVVLTILVSVMAVFLVLLASRVMTEPISRMIEVIRRVKQGRLDETMKVETQDELGELATAFNRMTKIIKHNKELEANLAQQGKMASLGVLSSGVAHEINNPLGVILGYAAYIEKKLSPDDPNYRFIHEIKRESKRCKKIVQDLLSYARTPQPVLEPTDLNALLEQIVDFAANHTDMHHVSVEKSFDPSLPEIMVDGDQLRQVAINLILNAGAAMQKGGKLVVSTQNGEDNCVSLKFSDNGAGIAAEHMERIFEPFFTTKVKGTGLGLAITRQIVEQHHGKIGIESEIGAGTTVEVRLPINRDDYC
ncbi:sensor histidine kinase, HAMP domain-containing [Citrifermentans bemidjiense Bem]|uniref:histidine kinase n=1 Tax=Citrifermentans bemidjiense (strain ATCC BAA-1014 / DSM 16622 / JCM 12645 / Bem) TaxID=404380 RepID=B5E805_CITBB|nr:cache domain-containing protein [Citrifermentans bemidjiense]ACH38541.1 sensor histidine kinase, HAMP domain-containing [Citrifermentans bemidjiense Bem]